MQYIFVIWLIYLATWVVAQTEQKTRVNVTVFYESLCPDARNFVVNQLYPALEGNFSEYVNLELIPYGKASRTSDINSQVKFTCQHGPSECFGNLIQGCARDLIDYGNNSEGLGFNRNHLEFVYCMMENSTLRSTQEDITATVHFCSSPKVISASRLFNCANNTFGVQHLIQYGKLTDNFQKPLKRVPTIVYNQKYSKEESQTSEINFVGELCTKISEPRPEECILALLKKNNSPSSANSMFNVFTILTWCTTILIFKHICSSPL